LPLSFQNILPHPSLALKFNEDAQIASGKKHLPPTTALFLFFQT